MRPSSFLAFLAIVALSSTARGGIILDYRFDGNAQDFSGQGNHGTIHGSPTFVASPNGQAIFFNNPQNFVQATQWVSIPNSQQILDFSTSSFTFAILYRSLDGDQLNGRLFGGGTGTSQVAYVYNATGFPNAFSRLDDVNGQTILTQTQSNGDPNGYTTDGSWHWGIGVFDRNAKQFRQYVDKNLVATVNYSTFGTIAIKDLWVGAISNQNSYGARSTAVDTFHLYNYALTGQEVDSLVDTGVVPEPATVVVLSFLTVGLARRRKRRWAPVP